MSGYLSFFIVVDFRAKALPERIICLTVVERPVKGWMQNKIDKLVVSIYK